LVPCPHQALSSLPLVHMHHPSRAAPSFIHRSSSCRMIPWARRNIGCVHLKPQKWCDRHWKISEDVHFQPPRFNRYDPHGEPYIKHTIFIIFWHAIFFMKFDRLWQHE
jgi:hypothetical protein